MHCIHLHVTDIFLKILCSSHLDVNFFISVIHKLVSFSPDTTQLRSCVTNSQQAGYSETQIELDRQTHNFFLPESSWLR